MLSSLSLVAEDGGAILVLFLRSRSSRAAFMNVGDGFPGGVLKAVVFAASNSLARLAAAFCSNIAVASFVLVGDGDGGASCTERGGDDGGVMWSRTNSSDCGSSEGECDRETRIGEIGSRDTRSIVSASPSE